jgi:hypothetical protein
MLVIGVATMIVSEVATLARIEPFYSWNTPTCWTGFILFADAVVFHARGRSWLRTSPREFAAMAVLSIPLWLVFEAYNLRIRNWYYTGLPENVVLRYAGYAWAFATIYPALFEAAELVAVVRHRTDTRPAPPARPALPARPVRPAVLCAGAAMLVSPFVVPSDVATYLAAPVWLGFILLLDPVNESLGGDSVTGDWRAGHTDRLVNLLAAGLLCGLLWEFWNYWAGAKWHYTVPILPSVRIFEMPVLGYFGFPPFAIECFAMYVSVRLLWRRNREGMVESRHRIAL